MKNVNHFSKPTLSPFALSISLESLLLVSLNVPKTDVDLEQEHSTFREKKVITVDIST